AHFFDSKCFIVNILAADQEALSTRFAKSGGEKFAGVAYHLGRLGTPILDGTLGHVECRIIETHEGGDHVIHIGTVEHAEVRGGHPLIFFQGQYRNLGEQEPPD
ncbi:MAG: flavin reductase family protein, partial [Deltaproteobacteria bacterium]